MSMAWRSLGVGLLALSFGACSREPARGPAAPAVRKASLVDISAKLQEARAATEAKRFDDAVAILTEAIKLRPDDAAARELLDLAHVGKRKDDFARALKSGRAALEADNYESAFAELSVAVKLMPDDQDAKVLLEQAEFHWRRQQGNAAMRAKRFQDAVGAFTAALQLRPDDGACRKLLEEAKEARRLQIRAEFGAAMTAGKASLADKNYRLAVNSFAQALALVPDDQEAKTLHGEARQKQNKIDFDQAMTAGKASLADKNYRLAVNSFAQALALVPDDQEAKTLHGEARQKQNKIDFDQAMTAGKAALAGNRPADAMREFEKAKQLLPGDAEADKQLREALTKKTKQEYDHHVSRARTALAGKRYDEALRACQDAERLIPGGAAATLRGDVQSRRQQDYNDHVTKARFALFGNRYDDAIRECQAAERLMFGGEAGLVRMQAESKKREQMFKKR